ncbi:MAG TPA: FecR family protein [Bryobacteraceae bacterium]|nr:FecR family protein [Bryobacteraceae bacterium]
MRLVTLLLVLAAAVAAQTRFARLGEFKGPVEVQLTAADSWIPAERNLPLTELAWVNTGAGARVEIEMDDGSVWRLGPNSLGEISDYTRLSTGQRITLLSLDHGIAYYTGQPAAKDVTMLVMPGTQATILQGSRVRETAQGGVSEAAILEGQVRFSSPTAEMDIHEGTTAHVEPANSSRFSLVDGIVVGPLDQWSEDRDKAEAKPASSAYVNAAFGLADLDSAGQWLRAGDLGMVWKPEVPDDWAPYQKGRWRYYDALGYTWVSDDSWGWMPYHNGRWARVEKMGWVWQPAVTTIFHPAEVYWLHGDQFAGWGPLAPGEEWTAPNPGSVTPRAYASGGTRYASFQQDARTIDGTGFPAPTAEQLKTAFFVTAPPSPAFVTSRLDAQRPMLQVGATRVMPSVPGVAFGDAAQPPSDIMTNPPAGEPPSPPASDAGVPPPPDGVYPVPAVIVPPVDVDIAVYPGTAGHPTYSTPRPTAAGPGTGNTAATPVQPSGSNPPTGIRTGNKPVGPANPLPIGPAPSNPGHPANEPPPVHHPAPPVTPPKSDDSGKKFAAAATEPDLYRMVLQDIDPKKPDLTKALSDLNLWSRKYPASSYSSERSYLLIHVYNRTDRPEQVLDAAAPLVQAGVRKNYGDPQQVLQILVAASSGVSKLRSPTAQQLATGHQAARELLEFLPEYFARNRKPSDVSEAAWSIARGQLEDVARQALAHHPAARLAAN